MLGKDKLNTIEVLASMSLFDSYINHDEMKGEIKNPETSVEHTI